MNNSYQSLPAHSFAGEVHSYYPEHDRVEVRPLARCCHCGYMWEHKPGSGRLRGFCQNCNGFVCGRPDCVAGGCVPEMQRLENIEAGLGCWSDFKPIKVSVPAIVPGR